MDGAPGCSGLSEKAEDERNSTGDGDTGQEAPKPLSTCTDSLFLPLSPSLFFGGELSDLQTGNART